MAQRTIGQGVGFERTRRGVKHGVGKPAYLCDIWAKTEVRKHAD